MVGETPPTLKAAMDETGRAGFRFGRAFSVADRARREELARVLKMDEKDSNVEMVAFALDGPYPDGEASDDFGVGSISLRKLLRSGADHALGPIEFRSVLDGKVIGQLTCAVTAVQALSAIEAERGGRDRAYTLPAPSPTSNAAGKAKTMNGRPVRPPSYKYQKELEELAEMGFSDTTNGNVDAAINKLVG